FCEEERRYPQNGRCQQGILALQAVTATEIYRESFPKGELFFYGPRRQLKINYELKITRTHYSYSLLTTRNSLLGTPYSALGTKHSELTPYSSLNSLLAFRYPLITVNVVMARKNIMM